MSEPTNKFSVEIQGKSGWVRITSADCMPKNYCIGYAKALIHKAPSPPVRIINSWSKEVVHTYPASKAPKAPEINPLQLFIFEDKADKRQAVVIDRKLTDAIKALKKITSIEFKVIQTIKVDQETKPAILVNFILPF